MFTRKLFEDFFDDIEIQSSGDDVISQKETTCAHNDSWEARFQLVVNMYSIVTNEKGKKECSV